MCVTFVYKMTFQIKEKILLEENAQKRLQYCVMQRLCGLWWMRSDIGYKMPMTMNGDQHHCQWDLFKSVSSNNVVVNFQKKPCLYYPGVYISSRLVIFYPAMISSTFIFCDEVKKNDFQVFDGGRPHSPERSGTLVSIQWLHNLHQLYTLANHIIKLNLNLCKDSSSEA